MLTKVDLKNIDKRIYNAFDTFIHDVFFPYMEKFEKRIDGRFDALERKMDNLTDKNVDYEVRIKNHDKRISRLETKTSYT